MSDGIDAMLRQIPPLLPNLNCEPLPRLLPAALFRDLVNEIAFLQYVAEQPAIPMAMVSAITPKAY